MCRIVVVVIDGGHSAHLVEAFDKHSLSVHIGKSHRTYHLGHATVARPLLGCREEHVGHFGVVDKIDETETRLLAACALIEPVVDNGCYTSYRLSVAVSHE